VLLRNVLGQFADPEESPWWISYAVAVSITLLAVGLVSVFWRGMGAIPDPGLVLLVAVAVSTYVAGGMAGMLSAFIVLMCSFILFSHPMYPFRYSEMDWRQVMAIVIACPLIALMVGSLKEQVDQLKRTTRDLQLAQDEIKRVEGLKDALYLSEQRFTLATDAFTDHAVVLLDTRGSIIQWSLGAERLLGHRSQDIMGKNYSDFFGREETLSGRPERLLEVAGFSNQVSEDVVCADKGQQRFAARILVHPVRNTSGKIAAFLVILRRTEGPVKAAA